MVITAASSTTLCIRLGLFVRRVWIFRGPDLGFLILIGCFRFLESIDEVLALAADH